MPKPLKVLMIEDDTEQIELYGFKFDIEGFAFLSATDGKAGIQMAIKEKPDLILLDILLASENGLELLDKIKQSMPIKNIPVIIFSNLYKEDLEQKSLSLGAVAYILKSQVTPAELVKRIKELVLR